MSSVSFRGKDRERAVLLLAGSCEDFGSWLSDPRGALMGKTPSGLAPGRKEPCGKCENGRVLDRFKRESKCPACDGRGWQWGDSGVPGVAVQTEETKAAPTKQPKTRRCLDCSGDGALPNGRRCKSCKGEGRIQVEAFVIADDTQTEKDPLDAYTAAIECRDKSGSYQDYLLLEAELRARSPHLLVPFRMVYVAVPRTPLESLSEQERYYVRRARDFLVEWMPDPIRVPRWVVEADDRARAQPVPKGRGVSKLALETRDVEIRRQFRDGVMVSDLSTAFGLSVKRVNEIVYSEREVA